MVQLALAGLIGLSSWNDRRQAGWNPPVFKRQLTLICAVMRLGLIRCFTPAVVQELVLSGQQSATLTFISDIERARQIQHLEARFNRCICPHPLSHERYPAFSQPCFFFATAMWKRWLGPRVCPDYYYFLSFLTRHMVMIDFCHGELDWRFGRSL